MQRILALLLLLVFAGTATAAPGDVRLREVLRFERIDVVNVGLGGIGAPLADGGGAGTLQLAGVAGNVELALLYWYGIDLDDPGDGFSGGDSDYDESGIVFDGQPVSGTRVGVRGYNNNWGDGDPYSAALYRADVTALLHGDGDYAVSGLADGAGHSAAGVSLVVYFDDGDSSNDRSVVHFEGMDSNVDDDPDEHWQRLLPIDHAGGGVEVVMHVGDAQASQSDGTVRFEVFPGVLPDASMRIDFSSPHPDGQPLWGGRSVPHADAGRPDSGEGLWDVRRFDLTPAFSLPRDYLMRLYYAGGSDFLTLAVLQVVQAAPGAPPALDPPQHDFGDVALPGSSMAQAFVFTNLRNESVTVVETQASPSAMAIDDETCTGAVLAPGDSCTLSARCTPPNALSYPGVVRVRATGSDAEPWATEAPLQCAGIGPDAVGRLSLDPPGAWLGGSLAGEARAARTFRATSIGAEPVTLRPVRTVGTHAYAFDVRNDGCADRVLAPGEQCTFEVLFAPAADRPLGRMVAALRLEFESTGAVHPLRDLPLGAVVLPDLDGVFSDGYEPP